MKNAAELTTKQTEHITLFLQIIRNKMKYIDSFNFTKNDEDEVAFLEYRRVLWLFFIETKIEFTCIQKLKGIYKIITKLSPQMVANFVHATVNAVIANFSSLSFFDVEVALNLLYSMGDGIQGLWG